MSAQQTPNLCINYKWSLGEDNWNVGMDENLLKLDSLIQLSVVSKDLNSPPPTTNPGDRYIVGSSPLYEWENNQNNITLYYDSIWIFILPKPGFIAYIKDIDKLYIYNNSNIWEEINTSNTPTDLTATNVSFTPTNKILSTNTQDAIEEVRDSIPVISGITAINISIDPIQNLISTNTQEALEEINTKINTASILYPLWKINENESIEVLERQEYGINSGILYLQGSIYLNIESVLVINN